METNFKSSIVYISLLDLLHITIILKVSSVLLSPAPAKRSGGYGNAGHPSVRDML